MPHYEQYKILKEASQIYNFQFQYANNLRTFLNICSIFLNNGKNLYICNSKLIYLIYELYFDKKNNYRVYCFEYYVFRFLFVL